MQALPDSCEETVTELCQRQLRPGSLLPVGLFQFEASVTTGMWYARSDEFLQQDFLETLRWVRTFGDVVFIVGAVAVAWQVVILGLWRKGARG